MSFLSIDGTLIVQLINFAIFFAILNVIFLRPVAAAIARRREYIKSVVSDYERYQVDAHELRAEANGIRAEARREAEHRVAAAHAQASNESAELSARYAAQAQQIVEAAQATAAAELDAARAGESDAVQRVARLMVERVIPEAVT